MVPPSRQRSRRFPAAVAREIAAIKYFRLRAGDDHRFTAIWVIVVAGRVFVRPWNDRPTGWYRAFRADPRGAIQVGDRILRVRARAIRGEKLNDSVDAAYSGKYDTKANAPYVKGFATARRRATTLELLPL